MKLIEGLTFELPYPGHHYTDPKEFFEKQAELTIKEMFQFFYRKAIEKGFLKKPETCECCQKKAKTENSINGHHDDYVYPLNVRWLCKSCHISLHHELKKIRKEKLIKEYLQFVEKNENSKEMENETEEK